MGYISDFTYNLFMLPFEMTVLHGFRRKGISKATGHILEIGVGTGVNSGYLEKDKISSVTAIDPQIRKSARIKLEKQFGEIKILEGEVESLPFADESFDTVVFTLVFCSVSNPLKGLEEIKRVLKDDGKLIFIEHVRPDNHRIRKAADKMNPAWNTFSNGCNINRETLDSIKSSGFDIIPGTFERKGVFITGIAAKTL